MILKRIALVPLLALSAAACAPGAGPDAEEQRLMETSRQWARAAAAGDVDAMMAFWSNDALVLQPGQAPLRGHGEIRPYIERSLKTPGFRISWEPQEARVSGDMGYLIERTTVTVNGPDGAPVTEQFRAVTIWRKQADGSWKNIVDTSNAGPAARKPAAG